MCSSGAVVNCSDWSSLKCWSHRFNSGWVHLYFRFFLDIHLPVCVSDVSLALKKITLIIQGCNRHWSKLPTYELGALKPLDIYVSLSAPKISKTSKLEVLGVLGENCICWWLKVTHGIKGMHCHHCSSKCTNWPTKLRLPYTWELRYSLSTILRWLSMDDMSVVVVT